MVSPNFSRSTATINALDTNYGYLEEDEAKMRAEVKSETLDNFEPEITFEVNKCFL